MTNTAKAVNPEQQMIYSIFVRNHTKEGTFAAVEKDLDRIQKLGTDIIWLMPIHPVGKEKRKGKDGSPYAIADYRTTAPEMGSEEELKHLVDEIHKRGMKCIIDVVYNHTSPDSVLYQTHPEWFYHDENGQPHGIVLDWSDIIDLDYSHPELREELIQTLEKWSGIVDGFRCDVATRIPLDFWKEARERTAKVNPDLFWLAESTHLPFAKFIRDQGRTAVCDADLYQAFDVLYDYDIFPFMEEYLKGNVPLSRWIEELNRQEAVFPADFIKLRYLENHDNPRIMSYLKPLAATAQEESWLRRNWLALQFFLKGMPMIYHGQEYGADHRPSIFDQDVVDLNPEGKEDTSNLIAELVRIHRSIPDHSPVFYEAEDDKDLAIIRRAGMVGLFGLKLPQNPDFEGPIRVPLKDGYYINEINGEAFEVIHGDVPLGVLPVITRTEDWKNETVF